MAKLIKFALILILVLFLSLPFGYGQNDSTENVTLEDFTVKLTPIENDITIDELAEFDLTITNNLQPKDEFRVYTLSYPDWDILTKPLINPITVEVGTYSTETIKLFIDPLHVTSTGRYAVSLNVRSKKTDKVVKKDAEVTIKSTESLIGGYVPTVTANVNMPSSIDPRKEIPIRIELKNQNIIDYPELTMKVESNTIKEELKMKLGPNEEKTIGLTKKVGLFEKPQNDMVQITLLMEDKVITGPLIQPIEIIEYSATEEESEKSFLKTVKKITVSSNDEGFKGPIKIEATQLGNLFTSTYPRAKILKENGKEYYTFDVELQNNVMEIRIVENYSPLFLVIILTVITIAVYFLYRSPLIMGKASQGVERKEGGISQLKIVLTVKNRSKKPIQAVDVIDKVPNIVDVEKEVHIGILQPSKILKHEKKGSIIKWSIDELHVGEERVISYRIKSRLPIIGDFTLESAVARFKHQGKERISHSNTLSVGS
jgi:hypothetical protein|tara:strand:- start:375 stop:1832 length:1458 start_codon:yes stop_codon:yes gene_type:complete